MLALDRRRIPNGIDRLQVDLAGSHQTPPEFLAVYSRERRKKKARCEELIVGSYEPGENSVRSCDRHVWRIE